MIFQGLIVPTLRSVILDSKVTLCRQGAPLLYAYDAFTFIDRLFGVHTLPALGPTDALILRPCTAIHTIGSTDTIDVIFLDEKGVILKLDSLKPNKVMLCLRGKAAVEMAKGTAARLQLAVGQKFVPSDGEW